MQNPTTSDPSFKKFLEDLQKDNNRSFATQLLQLKAEREVAGEDNEKQKAQLKDINKGLVDIKSVLTGKDLHFNVEPLVQAGENNTELLQKSLEELALIRKLTEGSVEFDKKLAGYRNISGREVQNKVSGKMAKVGDVIDFETARDFTSGQSKRAQEANAINLKTIDYVPGKSVSKAVKGQKVDTEIDTEANNKLKEKTQFQGFGKEIVSGLKFFMTDGLSEKEGYGLFQKPPKGVVKKERESEVTGGVGADKPVTVNQESDNIVSAPEAVAEGTKADLEVSKQLLETTREQLNVLKEIKEALVPKTPKELTEQKSAPLATEKEGEGGGSLLGGLADVAGDLLGGGKNKAGKAGKVAGKAGKVASMGGKLAKFATSNTGKALGSVAAVGLGAYTAYEGYAAAEDSKQAKLDEVQAQVDAGQLSTKDAAAQRKDIGNSATIEKSVAVGEGTGMAAGAIAGASLGATIGSIVPGVGTAIGGLAGGAIGAFAGSKAGKVVGEYGGKAINSVKDFFGSGKETTAKPAAVVPMETVTGKKTKLNTGVPTQSTTKTSFNEAEFAQKDPVNYKKFVDFRDTRIEQISKNSPFAKTDPETANSIAEVKATEEAIIKFKPEIEAVNAGKVSSTESKVTGGPGAKNPSIAAATVSSKETVAGKVSSAESKVPEGLSAKNPSIAAATVSSKETVTGKIVTPKTDESYQVTNVTPTKSAGGGKIPGGGQITDPNAPGYNADAAEYQRDRQSILAKTTNVIPVKGVPVGAEVARTSTENADMGREAGKSGGNNTIVSNNVSSNNTTKFVPMKPSPRPQSQGSALDRYQDRVTVY